jgi:ribonuclease Z
MSWLVQGRLVNGPFGDPGLFVDVRHGARALLFDLGDVSALSPRELMRVSDVVVTHRHMDHFVGFDLLLRLRLNRPGVLRMIGPPDFVEGVRGKLQAYSWNLLGSQSADFVLQATEFDGVRLGPPVTFAARRGFEPEMGEPLAVPPGVILSDPDFEIEAKVLDHGIPCLGLALQERRQVNVSTEGLAELGLPVGPWLRPAKTAVRSGAPDDTVVDAGARRVPLGLLRERAFRVAPGQRLAYVTDAAFHPENADRIVAIAKGAQDFFIEAAFLDVDAPLAVERRHLTAGQAGRLARAAGARRLTTFHHSPRYLDRPDALAEEAERAFRGEGAGVAFGGGMG